MCAILTRVCLNSGLEIHPFRYLNGRQSCVGFQLPNGTTITKPTSDSATTSTENTCSQEYRTVIRRVSIQVNSTSQIHLHEDLRRADPVHLARNRLVPDDSHIATSPQVLDSDDYLRKTKRTIERQMDSNHRSPVHETDTLTAEPCRLFLWCEMYLAMTI